MDSAVNTYFEAWAKRDPQLLRGILSPDVSVTGPLGQLDGADVYERALGHIFRLTRSINIVKQWVDGPDTLTWFDLNHTHGPDPLPVANWVHVDNGLIARVRIAFDARHILP